MKSQTTEKVNRGLILALVFGFAIQAAIIAYLGFQARSNPARVAYVDTAVLISQFSEAKKARADLEKFNKTWQDKAKDIKDSMDVYMQRMGADYNIATSAKKEQMRREMQARNQEMEGFVNSNQKKSFEKEKELMDPVLKKINVFMKEYTENQGYDIILGSTTSGNIMGAGKRLNITQAVLDGINKQYP